MDSVIRTAALRIAPVRGAATEITATAGVGAATEAVAATTAISIGRGTRTADEADDELIVKHKCVSSTLYEALSPSFVLGKNQREQQNDEESIIRNKANRRRLNNNNNNYNVLVKNDDGNVNDVNYDDDDDGGDGGGGGTRGGGGGGVDDRAGDDNGCNAELADVDEEGDETANAKGGISGVRGCYAIAIMKLIFDKFSSLRRHHHHNHNHHYHNQHNHHNYFVNSRFHKRRIFYWNSIGYLIFSIGLVSSFSLAIKQDAPTNCMFPQRWEGSWFQSGVQQSITIKGSSLSIRGKCIASDGDKFLMVNEKGCHRCVVIYEKHKNVLQYKESECEDMYMMYQTNPAAMPMRSSIINNNNNNHNNNQNHNSDHISNSNNRGVHPNINVNVGGGGDDDDGGRDNHDGGIGISSQSRLSSSDQFLLRSQDDVVNCAGCRGRETLQYLCEQIPGDALLYSMFKENSEPVKCPLKGPFTFTYNRGHGECKSPVSNIESCTEDSRLLLSFQACPDVSGTESTIEELTCLATWKDGNARYLIGLVSHHHAISNEERFRCFVYEKMPSGGSGSSKDSEYKLAQSGDATCNGLESAEVGSRIMTLRKAPPAERCDFPAWFKGPRFWGALMGNNGYVFHPNDGSIHIIKQSGYMETRALCEQINKQTSTEMMAVVHYTTGCQSGFMCWMFYRRDTHVAEMQMGKPATRLEDACALDYFDINKLPYVTLIVSTPESQICPLGGLYTLRGQIGPPHMNSRHKRNHNNNNSNSNSKNNTNKRYRALSFRNTEETNQQSIVKSLGRNISLRQRRSLAENKANANATKESIPRITSISSNIQITGALETDRKRRDAPNCVVNYNAKRQLLVGCNEPNIIETRPVCNGNEDGDEVYTCHGSWSENHTTFIVARHVGSQHGVCISYKQGEGNNAQLIIGDTCFRGAGGSPPPDHHLVSSLTRFGDETCVDTSSSSLIECCKFLYGLTILTVVWKCRIIFRFSL